MHINASGEFKQELRKRPRSIQIFLINDSIAIYQWWQERNQNANSWSVKVICKQIIIESSIYFVIEYLASLAYWTRYLDLAYNFWSFVNLNKHFYCWWKMANSNFGTSSYQAGREGDFSKLSQQIGTNIQKISQNGKFIALQNCLKSDRTLIHIMF
jgi:hypothetical protein